MENFRFLNLNDTYGKPFQSKLKASLLKSIKNCWDFTPTLQKNWLFPCFWVLFSFSIFWLLANFELWGINGFVFFITRRANNEVIIALELWKLKLVSKNENWNWVSDHTWATLGFDWSWCLTCWGQGRRLASFLPAFKSPSTSCLGRLATATPSWSQWQLSSSTASSSSARRSSSTPLDRSYFQPSPRSSTSKRTSMVSRSSFSVATI